MERINRLGNAAATSACLVFMLLLLLPPFLVLWGDDGMLMVEGRDCESKSHRFHGRCMSNNNCKLVCHNEGFTGGKCHGMRGRCFCTKPC
ncbi:defensin Ec-AMP-D1-like [Andrographis paniculata]|uniref:defensin Ec-AMP-D1-like n=1 Tax=Andrographis paniculata TaxID=175694 RepID=UPI0021E7326D|nr:defensin Ec-AMP-D1-like [Andrographis paniculata]